MFSVCTFLETEDCGKGEEDISHAGSSYLCINMLILLLLLNTRFS